MRTLLIRLRRLLTTSRCRACRERYPRRLARCPVCGCRRGFAWDELDERGRQALGIANIGGPHR